jgi:hypothetical protein
MSEDIKILSNAEINIRKKELEYEYKMSQKKIVEELEKMEKMNNEYNKLNEIYNNRINGHLL